MWITPHSSWIWLLDISGELIWILDQLDLSLDMDLVLCDVLGEVHTSQP